MTGATDAVENSTARNAAARVALISTLVCVVVVVALAASRGGPDWFVKFGEGSTITSYGREVLGDDLTVPFDEAQDGTSFWALARDPFLRDTTVLERNLDRPSYRAQRMLYPWLAAPWSFGGEQALLWGLVITNVAAIGLGTWFTARLGLLLGGRAEIGYVFALNPAVVVALMLDLAEIVSLAGLAAVVLLVRRGEWLPAVVAASIAVLAKEASWPVVLAVALGAGLLGLAGTGRVAWKRCLALAVVPAALAAVWAVYVRSRFGGQNFAAQEFTAIPFGGYADAWRLAWRPAGHWGDLAAAVLAVGASAAVIVRWWRRRSLELWAALPYALVVPFLSFQVVNRSINMVRGVAPVLLFLLVDWLAARRRASHATTAVT